MLQNFDVAMIIRFRVKAKGRIVTVTTIESRADGLRYFDVRSKELEIKSTIVSSVLLFGFLKLYAVCSF